MTALEKFFPGARLQRFDTDNLKAERFDKHYKNVAEGNVDIIVGTQMLIKGLDLPRLSFVGVISADTALSFPDYTASERTYQLLVQVLGRIGRGHVKGSAVIQTHQPESPAIQAALKKDWDSFYAAEIKEREQFLYSPFVFLLKLTVSRKNLSGARRAAEELAQTLRTSGLAIKTIGPAPSFYEKTAGLYRWQIIVKSRRRQVLADIVTTLPAGWYYDLDPTNLL